MYNKILQETKNITSINDLPADVFASVRSSLEEYFESKSDDGEQEEAVVVASDGSLQKKKLDFKLRSALENEFSDEELSKMPRYSFDGKSTVTVPSGSQFTMTDDMSFMEDKVVTVGDQTVPLHYQIYYRISVDTATEELVLVDAIYHTHTYAEYLNYR